MLEKGEQIEGKKVRTKFEEIIRPTLMGIDDVPDKIPTYHLKFCPLGFCQLVFIPATTITTIFIFIFIFIIIIHNLSEKVWTNSHVI